MCEKQLAFYCIEMLGNLIIVKLINWPLAIIIDFPRNRVRLALRTVPGHPSPPPMQLINIFSRFNLVVESLLASGHCNVTCLKGKELICIQQLWIAEPVIVSALGHATPTVTPASRSVSERHLGSFHMQRQSWRINVQDGSIWSQIAHL